LRTAVTDHDCVLINGAYEALSELKRYGYKLILAPFSITVTNDFRY